MKLSFHILCDYLPTEYYCEILGNPRHSKGLSRPVLYTGEGPMDERRLYVTRTDLLPPTEEIGCRCLVCIGRGDLSELISAGHTVLRISDAKDFLHVFNDICAVYDRFDNWENLLRDQLEQEEDFDYQSMALTASEMMDNPIGMSDQFLHVLFTTERQADGSFRITKGKYDAMLLELDEEIAAVCQKERQLKGPYLSAFNMSPGGTPYCYNIAPMGHFAGCTFLYPEYHPFRESDYEIADIFFRYFSRGFAKHIRTFRDQENNVVRAISTLLKGLPLTRAEQDLFALEEPESWLLFRLGPLAGTKAMPAEYMAATIGSLMPGDAYAGLDEEAVTGILKVNSRIPLKENLSFISFQNILTHMGYCAGMSTPFRRLDNMEEYRFQADYSLQCAGRGKVGQKPYALFNDYVLDYMLSSCASNLSLDSLFSRQFKNLLEYDKTHDAQLRETLECYLRNESSISETARDLYLHRSSLIKRLERIKSILECDLTNPNLNLYYRMCLELIRRDVK